MSKETIVLKVKDIVQNPFLACDYLFIEEKRKVLEAASNLEMKAFLDLLQKDKTKITEILASSSYKAYVNSQKGIKNYQEQMQILKTLATTAIDTAAGAPISTVLVLFAQAALNNFNIKKMDKFVNEFQQSLSRTHTGKRIEDLY